MPLSLVCLRVLNPDQIAPMQKAAQAEEIHFIDRLVTEYATGINCFDRPGEVLFGMFEDQRLVGIGGLNCDPYHPDHNFRLAPWLPDDLLPEALRIANLIGNTKGQTLLLPPI
jgi:hypothetical protein